MLSDEDNAADQDSEEDREDGMDGREKNGFGEDLDAFTVRSFPDNKLDGSAGREMYS